MSFAAFVAFAFQSAVTRRRGGIRAFSGFCVDRRECCADSSRRCAASSSASRFLRELHQDGNQSIGSHCSHAWPDRSERRFAGPGAMHDQAGRVVVTDGIAQTDERLGHDRCDRSRRFDLHQRQRAIARGVYFAPHGGGLDAHLDLSAFSRGNWSGRLMNWATARVARGTHETARFVTRA